jgi:hypothetical protein
MWRVWKEGNAYRILTRNLKERKHLGSPRLWWEGNIKINLAERR